MKMNKLQIVEKLSKMTGKTGLVAAKNAPTILVVGGVIGIVASTILACRATLKVEDILDEHQEKKEKIEEVWQKVVDGDMSEEKYSESDKKKDLTVTYVQTAVTMVVNYAPAVILGGLSIACILKSHSIMKTRNLALMAAYKTLDEGFKSYRRRVVEEYGEDKDYQYKNGLRSETVIEKTTDENGKTKSVKKEVLVSNDDPNNLSIYAKYFDESCLNWSKSPEYSMLFLKAQQSYFNDMLRVRGHVFLNEVYDALGIERTKAGSVVGWVMGEGRANSIDFGLYDGRERARAFVNGYERTIILDFNVDGVIYDLI